VDNRGPFPLEAAYRFDSAQTFPNSAGCLAWRLLRYPDVSVNFWRGAV